MKTNAGFTLIEILIVVVIVAILAAVAVPSYRDYVIKSDRTVGRGALLEVAGRQEQFFVNNNQYATQLTQLGYAFNTVGLTKQGETGAAGTGIYNITFSAASATGFTVQADPINSQAADSKCETLTLNNIGVKGLADGATGSVADCW